MEPIIVNYTVIALAIIIGYLVAVLSSARTIKEVMLFSLCVIISTIVVMLVKVGTWI